MPAGAKKRKALKKKQQQQQQQESSTNTNGSNGYNHHEENGQGRQDDRESDESSLSSPASQGNGEFGGGTKNDPSVLVKDTAKEISYHATQGLGANNGTIPIVVERGTANKKKNIVDLASPEKSEHPESSTHSNLVNKKSDEKKEYSSPEKDNGEVAAGTSRKVETIREPEAPVSTEEKRLLLTAPPAVRTSWLSCCGLFDAVTGSDR